MLSIEFSTELSPESRLRRLVVGSGVVLLALGLLVIAVMSTPPGIRVLIAIVWLVPTSRQLLRMLRHYAVVQRIRVYPDGSARIATADGAWQPASLGSGSVVLERVAWLRLDTGDGPAVGELLTGNSRKNKDWRRLQVIWRHLGSAA